MRVIDEVTIVKGTFKGLKGVRIEDRDETFVIVELYEGSTVGIPREDLTGIEDIRK